MTDMPAPYAHWHLNETSGTTISDVSGNARNGTLQLNAAWNSGGKLNYCLYVPFANFGNICSFERTDSFSIEAWVKYTGTEAPGSMICRQSNTVFNGWAIRNMSGKIEIMLINTFGSNQIRKRTQSTFNDGNWHHLVITYNGSSLASGVLIYLDNALQTCDVVTDALSASIIANADLMWGTRGLLTNYGIGWTGYIDECVIYTTVLSTDQITARYNAGSGTEDIHHDIAISDTLGLVESFSGSVGMIQSDSLGITEELGGNVGMTVSDSLHIEENIVITLLKKFFGKAKRWIKPEEKEFTKIVSIIGTPYRNLEQLIDIIGVPTQEFSVSTLVTGSPFIQRIVETKILRKKSIEEILKLILEEDE